MVSIQLDPDVVRRLTESSPHGPRVGRPLFKHLLALEELNAALLLKLPGLALKNIPGRDLAGLPQHKHGGGRGEGRALASAAHLLELLPERHACDWPTTGASVGVQAPAGTLGEGGPGRQAAQNARVRKPRERQVLPRRSAAVPAEALQLRHKHRPRGAGPREQWGLAAALPSAERTYAPARSAAARDGGCSCCPCGRRADNRPRAHGPAPGSPRGGCWEAGRDETRPRLRLEWKGHVGGPSEPHAARDKR
eukprot:scaffold377_cov563-Prasinococcus_capsulatus_cf.AAC.8